MKMIENKYDRRNIKMVSVVFCVIYITWYFFAHRMIVDGSYSVVYIVATAFSTLTLLFFLVLHNQQRLFFAMKKEHFEYVGKIWSCSDRTASLQAVLRGLFVCEGEYLQMPFVVLGHRFECWNNSYSTKLLLFFFWGMRRKTKEFHMDMQIFCAMSEFIDTISHIHDSRYGLYEIQYSFVSTCKCIEKNSQERGFKFKQNLFAIMRYAVAEKSMIYAHELRLSKNGVKLLQRNDYFLNGVQSLQEQMPAMCQASILPELFNGHVARMFQGNSDQLSAISNTWQNLLSDMNLKREGYAHAVNMLTWFLSVEKKFFQGRSFSRMVQVAKNPNTMMNNLQ